MNKIDYKNIKALLLDLDGTLINSERAFYKAFEYILEKYYGVIITKEEYKKYELEQNAKLLEYKRKEYSSLVGIDDNEIYSKLYEEYMNFFEDIIKEKEASDNFEVLKELKGKGMTLALVTTCRWIYLNKLIETYDLSDTFDFIIGRDDVKPELLKPNPEAYLITLKKLGLDPNVCLSIEDSKRGVDAALAAGIRTIKVDNFTEIKYEDDRVESEESANKVLRKFYL